MGVWTEEGEAIMEQLETRKTRGMRVIKNTIAQRGVGWELGGVERRVRLPV